MGLITSSYLKRKKPGDHAWGELIDWIYSALKFVRLDVVALQNSRIYGEVPDGLIDGANKAFTLENTPFSGTLRLYYNGRRLKEGFDYTILSNVITLEFAPENGQGYTDILLADYDLAATNNIYGEVPVGVVDGANKAYTLENTPAPGTLRLYCNGRRLKESFDYAIDDNVITLEFAPENGQGYTDILLADYEY